MLVASQVRNGYGNTTLRNSYDAVVATMHAQLKVYRRERERVGDYRARMCGRCEDERFTLNVLQLLLLRSFHSSTLFDSLLCASSPPSHLLPPLLKAQTVDLRDVSEVPHPSTGHTSQNKGGGGGQHDSVNETKNEGTTLAACIRTYLSDRIQEAHFPSRLPNAILPISLNVHHSLPLSAPSFE